ncbi:uncharacterized protein LOC105691746 [Athalia rosae]|uniref:uncharacterized protein LOC105691746 n=1 Tax=Athalia rosae TaxID=37344 RepID=UPI0020336DB6|nr:uncharacterized protein LOC105691746 [Athalia rosae]
MVYKVENCETAFQIYRTHGEYFYLYFENRNRKTAKKLKEKEKMRWKEICFADMTPSVCVQDVRVRTRWCTQATVRCAVKMHVRTYIRNRQRGVEMGRQNCAHLTTSSLKRVAESEGNEIDNVAREKRKELRWL